jgi:hypothetical protein
MTRRRPLPHINIIMITRASSRKLLACRCCERDGEPAEFGGLVLRCGCDVEGAELCYDAERDVRLGKGREGKGKGREGWERGSVLPVSVGCD